MSSKEILDKNAKEILKRILQGESLSKIQEEYKIDKGTITDYYRNIFQNDERALETFDEVLELRKKKTSKVEIDNTELKKYSIAYLSGKLTLKQVQAELGIHYQTFKKLMTEFIANNETLSKMYENKKKAREDYSKIDFKKLAIEMLETRCTQSEIEEKYNLKPKTFSKKLAGFRNTENEKIYKACKMLAEAKMDKRSLTDEEIKYINTVRDDYKENER